MPMLLRQETMVLLQAWALVRLPKWSTGGPFHTSRRLLIFELRGTILSKSGHVPQARKNNSSYFLHTSDIQNRPLDKLHFIDEIC